MREKRSGIYVMKSLDSLYKIGFSDDVDRRKRQLEKELARPLEIVIFGESTRGFIVETVLHQKFESKWDHGEWYHLDSDDLAFIQSLADGGDVTSFFWAFKMVMDHARAKNPQVFADAEEWARTHDSQQRRNHDT